jgi:phospholipase C
MEKDSKYSREPIGGLTRRGVLARLGAGLGAGLLPGAGCSLGPQVCSAPLPDVPPGSERDIAARALLSHIDTFVVVMLENRSFDHLLGGLCMDPDYPARSQLDGLTGSESNPDDEGRPVRIAPMPGDGRGTVNPEHHWQEVHATFNQGRNDRFVLVNQGPHQSEVMGYLKRDQVPLFHALADRYTVFDHWFSSYMGQTWPNRYYLHATTSGGQRINHPLGFNAPLTIWERMAQRCCSGRNYAAGRVLWHTVAFPSRVFSGESAMVPGTIEDFFRDARGGNLPNLALIDPDFAVNDAYPTRSPAPCEAFVASIVKALAESPQWSRTLMLVIFDEHGGFYDHVPPPSTVDLRPDFRQLGFRVPALAIGPTVRTGAVVSTPLEHVSLAATLRDRFSIETLSPRMDVTSGISDCIDPRRVVAPSPPPRDLQPVELTASMVAGLTSQASSQPELEAALQAGGLPVDLVDSRSDRDRLSSWLRHAQELEAVKIRR